MSGEGAVAEVLAAVTRRIDEVLAALTQDWDEVVAGNDDLLGDSDLPSLVTTAAAGGKRLRPQLEAWGWVNAGAPMSAAGQVVELGSALELLHVFALVHDDVMDGSELRRGQPAVHAKVRDRHELARAHGDPGAFGNHIAVLAGDLLHAEADHLVSSLPAPVRAMWRTMVVELVAGQRLDLTGAALGRRDLDQARRVADLKSGSYTVQRPLQMGALVGGTDQAVLACLSEFGRHAGQAFGLRDDLLGTWGDPERTGKSSWDDLETGKPTVLLSLAADRLGPDDRDRLARTGTGTLDQSELRSLREAMEAAGVRDEVERLVADEVAMACAALDPDILPAEGISGLTQVVRRLAWRES